MLWAHAASVHLIQFNLYSLLFQLTHLKRSLPRNIVMGTTDFWPGLFCSFSMDATWWYRCHKAFLVTEAKWRAMTFHSTSFNSYRQTALQFIDIFNEPTLLSKQNGPVCGLYVAISMSVIGFHCTGLTVCSAAREDFYWVQHFRVHNIKLFWAVQVFIIVVT